MSKSLFRPTLRFTGTEDFGLQIHLLALATVAGEGAHLFKSSGKNIGGRLNSKRGEMNLFLGKMRMGSHVYG